MSRLRTRAAQGAAGDPSHPSGSSSFVASPVSVPREGPGLSELGFGPECLPRTADSSKDRHRVLERCQGFPSGATIHQPDLGWKRAQADSAIIHLLHFYLKNVKRTEKFQEDYHKLL